MVKEEVLAGGRQSGKSYRAMTLAIEAAQRGERVIYDCDSRRMVQERFLDLQQRVPASDMAKVVRANGDERIDFCSGGTILFVASRSGGGRGLITDLHVIDHDRGEGEVNPTAQRVIRTKLAPVAG